MRVGTGTRLATTIEQRSALALCCLLCALCLSPLVCCSSNNPPLAPPPRSAGTDQSAALGPAGAHHGFDPRRYAGKPAISTQRGAASFYADRFAGRKTANGERYDPNAYTCAHRTLPFGSVLRVVHERTGDWVLVRVNDRGPYSGKRILDLSRQAARRLSMVQEGVTRVRIEILELGKR